MDKFQDFPRVNASLFKKDFIYLLIYLFLFESQLEGREMFHLLFHSPQGHNSKRWHRRRPGTWNSFQVSHVRGRSSKTYTAEQRPSSQYDPQQITISEPNTKMGTSTSNTHFGEL